MQVARKTEIVDALQRVPEYHQWLLVVVAKVRDLLQGQLEESRIYSLDTGIGIRVPIEMGDSGTRREYELDVFLVASERDERLGGFVGYFFG